MTLSQTGYYKLKRTIFSTVEDKTEDEVLHELTEKTRISSCIILQTTLSGARGALTRIQKEISKWSEIKNHGVLGLPSNTRLPYTWQLVEEYKEMLLDASETILAGLYELAQFFYLRISLILKYSIGRSIANRNVYEMLIRDFVIPDNNSHERTYEHVRTLEDIVDKDKAGMIFSPVVGILEPTHWDGIGD